MERFTMDRLSPRVLAGLDLQTVFMASRLVVAAERSQTFRKLSGRNQSAAVIGRRLGIHPSCSEGFLNALVSLGLLRKRGNYTAHRPWARSTSLKGAPIRPRPRLALGSGGLPYAG
jgi:hypothetical protein